MKWPADIFIHSAACAVNLKGLGSFANGVGLKYFVGGITTKLDHSYTDFGRLNSVHRASIGFGFCWVI